MGVQEPCLDEHGHEHHPGWATIGASRISVTSGVNLFDSDVLHRNTVRIVIRGAIRRRELHHDWIHGNKDIIEVELSESQWASFVSAMNSGSGVPCSLRRHAGVEIPDFPHEPRLAESIAETHDAAEHAFADIKKAMTAYEKAETAKEKRDTMRTLKATIDNAVPNVDFAGKQLVEHAEDVVNKVKADVEAFVIAKAQQLGIEGADVLALNPGGI